MRRPYQAEAPRFTLHWVLNSKDELELTGTSCALECGLLSVFWGEKIYWDGPPPPTLLPVPTALLAPVLQGPRESPSLGQWGLIIKNRGVSSA